MSLLNQLKLFFCIFLTFSTATGYSSAYSDRGGIDESEWNDAEDDTEISGVLIICYIQFDLCRRQKVTGYLGKSIYITSLCF